MDGTEIGARRVRDVRDQKHQATDAVTRAILRSGITPVPVTLLCNSAYKQISKFHAQLNIRPAVSPRDTRASVLASLPQSGHSLSEGLN